MNFQGNIYKNFKRARFIDKVEPPMSISSATSQSNFEIRFLIGYHVDLIPFEIEMMVESIEIFTWQGEFNNDKI